MVATVTYSLETLQAELQANSFETGSQLAPDVLGLANGGYVVAYNSGNFADGSIRLDFYNANGEAIGSFVEAFDNIANTDAVGWPSLAQLSNGNVVVVWQDENPANEGIEGRILTDTGGIVSDELTFVGSASVGSPQVTALEEGFVVTYELGTNVSAHIYDETGDLISGIAINTTVAGTQSEPVITMLADGGFVVTFTDDSTGDLRLMARIFDADGTPRVVDGSTDDFHVGTPCSEPAIAALPNGNWVVAYVDTTGGNDDVRIEFSIRGPNGELVTVLPVHNPTDPDDEADPEITVLANGFIVVSWTFPALGSNDIYGRIFDQDGNAVTVDGDTNQFVLTSTGTEDIRSAVSALLAGQFAAVWQDSFSDGSGQRITMELNELVRTTAGDGAYETLVGDQLRDVMAGNGGDDTLDGGAARDDLSGGSGDDTLRGGAGADVLDGGSGLDFASYAGAAAKVIASLANSTINRGDAAGDTFASIENLIGSSFDDALNGSNGSNDIRGDAGSDTIKGYTDDDDVYGQDGNDTLIGGAGADYLSGGTGSDTASYLGATAAVIASLANPAINAGDAADDTWNSVENLTGSDFDDALNGSNGINDIRGDDGDDAIKGYAGNDKLFGQDGNDTLIGGAGADYLSGGTGNDIASYAGATAAVIASLANPAINTGDAAGDTWNSVENLTGSSFDDAFNGNSAANIINGGAGDDTIKGYAANDTLTGGTGNDTFLFNTAPDTTENYDQISDFNVAADTISLDNAVFTALGAPGGLAASAFHSGAVAGDASDRIIYNPLTGNVAYDADGTDVTAAIRFATLDTGLALTNADFVVI